MSRKTEIVTVPAEWGQRDANHKFKITEMPALQAEWWGVRMMLLMSGANVQLSDDLAGRGMEAVAIFGINAIMRSPIDPEKLKPLWDELLTCVQIIRDDTKTDAHGQLIGSALVSPDDISEVRTVLWLRSEVVRIHINFSPADALSAFLSWMAKRPSQED